MLNSLRRDPIAAIVVLLALVWLAVGAAVLADEGSPPDLLFPGAGAPTAVDDVYGPQAEDAPVLLDVTANDLPSTGGNKILVWCGTPTYGTASISSGKVLYTPKDRSEPYTATFSYEIEGDYPETDYGTVTVTVSADNDPVNLSDHTEYLDRYDYVSGNATVMLDPAEGGETHTFAFWDSEGNPDPWGWPPNGDYSYYGDDYHETVTKTYTVLVTDTAGYTDTAFLHFVITGTNEPLVDGVLFNAVEEDGGFWASFYPANKEWYEPLTLTAEISPTYGSLALFPGEGAGWSYRAADRSTSYTDTLTIRLTDTIPSTALFTATMTVTAQNDLPVCSHFSGAPDALVNDLWQDFVYLYDPDVDQTPTVVISSGPGWISAVPHDALTVRLEGTPSLADEGETQVVARAYDGVAYGNTITLTFDVQPLRQVTYVDGTFGSNSPGQGGGSGYDAYQTIGHAIERTAYTGTIRVAPGVYQEGITLSKEISLQPAIEGGTGERVVLDGSSSAYDIGALVYGSRFSVTGFDFVNADRGVHVNPGAEDVSLRWCNIEGNATGVSAPHATQPVDARYNWWGSADGPSGEGPGSGDPVTENVLYEPWLRAPVVGVARETISGTATLDVKESVGLTATISSTLPVSLTLAQYEGNPQAPFLYEGDQFWDVQLVESAGVGGLVVRFYFDPSYVDTINRWLSKIMFWDATSSTWVPCSHQEWWRPSRWSDWQAIDVTFGPDTVPSLSDITGTEFGFRAMPDIWPNGLSMQRTGGPTRFGPGWNLRFEMVISNTAPIPLHNVVISDIVPVAMYNVMESTGGFGEPTIEEAVYCCEYHIYTIDELAPGETLTQTWTYHTPSNMADGQGFLYEAIGTSFEGDWAFVGMALHCDHSLREPTPAPSSTPVPEGVRVVLPVMLKP